MENNPIFGYNLKYNDDLDLIKKVIKIFATVTNVEKDENYLRTRLVTVLAFYIMFGYSKDTKELIVQSLSIKKTNLNQINTELNKKGYLVLDKHNFRKKHLSKDMDILRQYFLEGDFKKLFLINFEKI